MAILLWFGKDVKHHQALERCWSSPCLVNWTVSFDSRTAVAHLYTSACLPPPCAGPLWLRSQGLQQHSQYLFTTQAPCTKQETVEPLMKDPPTPTPKLFFKVILNEEGQSLVSGGLAKKHLARHSERGEKTRRTEDEVGRQHQGSGQAWSSQSSRGQWRTEKNGGNWLWNHLWYPPPPPPSYPCS